jgi:polysaccharide pyruvyl transferase WcaK-like protein
LLWIVPECYLLSASLVAAFAKLRQGDRPVKLGLISTYSTRNLGDAAIYSALAQMAPERRVHCDLAESYPTLVRGLERNGTVMGCDAFVSVGGDIFNNARPRLVTRRFLSLLWEVLSHGRQAFVFGQSIPPSCRGAALRMLAAAFRRLGAVVVRDTRSRKLLKEHGIAAELSYDTAFVLRPQAAAIHAAYGLLERHGLVPERTVLISLRGGSTMYGLDDRECDRDLAMITQQLTARGHQPALLVQADCDAGDTDKMQAMRLAKLAGGVPVIDPFTIPPPMSPCEVLTALLSVANIVVGVRYHSAILRLVSGRAPFVLYYSNKGRDLCERLSLPGQRLSSGVDEDLILAIEKSGEMSFDPNPISRDVTQHFNMCLQKVAP